VGAPARGVADALGTSGVRFLFDENVPPAFAEALRLVGYSAVSNREVGLRGADDPVVIDYCANNNAVWVTKDLDARKRAAYTTQVRDLGVSATFLQTPRAKRWSMKEQFEVIARQIRTLEDRYGDRQPRYFFLRATGQPREVGTFGARPGR
jgi:predicted nuclease of predicted toxin-antitoxin system